MNVNAADAGARMGTGATALYDLPELIVQLPQNFKLMVEEDGRKVTISDPDEIRRRTGSHPDDEYQARLAIARILWGRRRKISQARRVSVNTWKLARDSQTKTTGQAGRFCFADFYRQSGHTPQKLR